MPLWGKRRSSTRAFCCEMGLMVAPVNCGDESNYCDLREMADWKLFV